VLSNIFLDPLEHLMAEKGFETRWTIMAMCRIVFCRAEWY
jgi:hypothetical protein